MCFPGVGQRGRTGGYAATVTSPGLDERLVPPLDDALVSGAPGSRGCPFLVADGGGWRLDVPAKDHRCTAVSPAAALSPEKQVRLCLTAAHTSCATFIASMEARGTRLGAPPPGTSVTRWGLTRTTAVIEDAGGVRSRVLGAVADRRRWPAVPAVLLLTGLVVLGLSGLRGTPASAVATPSRPPSVPAASPTPRATERPTAAPTTAAPSAESTTPATVAPTIVPPPTTGPVESFRIYTVKSGDTLSAIASQFGTTSRAIADLNGIKVSTTLHIGQKLKIPNA